MKDLKLSENLFNEIMFHCFKSEPVIIPTFKECIEYKEFVSNGTLPTSVNRLLKARKGLDFTSTDLREKHYPNLFTIDEYRKYCTGMPYGETVFKKMFPNAQFVVIEE